MARVGQVLAVLPDDYYTQIGAIIAKWATIEHMMMTIIWAAMGLDKKEGRVLTVGMGTQVLCGILRNLPRKWVTDPPTQANLKNLVDTISKHADGRNYLAHGIWTQFPDDPLPYLNFMKQGEHRILPAAQAVKPEELKNFSLMLDSMIRLANKILTQLGADAVPPSPDTPGERNPAGLPTQTQTPQ